MEILAHYEQIITKQMLTNKDYKRLKRKNTINLLKNIVFATAFTIGTAYIMKQCSKVNAMEKESELEEIVNNEKPYCLHNNFLQYQSTDITYKHIHYCALSESRCPYYHRDKNKEYCNATQKVKKKGF